MHIKTQVPPGSPDAAVRLRTAKYPSVRYSSCFDLCGSKVTKGHSAHFHEKCPLTTQYYVQ